MTNLNSDQEGEISRRVLETVAEEVGTSPIGLRDPLHDAIDPDALNAIYSNGRAPDRVEFTYMDHRVEVNEHGEVAIIDSRK